jgi:hypothetical protein
MALTATDFLSSSGGDIEPDTWPTGSSGGSTTERLDAWIAEAVVRTSGISAAERDAAGRHYVYAKAYRAMASRMASIPSSASQAGISHTISPTQIAYWERLAHQHEAKFEEFLVAPERPPSTPPGSRSVPIRAVW